MIRTGEITRKTRETDINIKVELDGKGTADISTGIGFFDHMLTALSVHSVISMSIKVHDFFIIGNADNRSKRIHPCLIIHKEIMISAYNNHFTNFRKFI